MGTIKIMISLPEDLLDAVDGAAERANTSRSAFVRDALRQRLAQGEPEGRHKAVAALRRSLAGGSWVAEDLVRLERDR